MSGLGSTLQFCVVKVADDVIAKINNIFSVKTLEVSACIVPVNLNKPIKEVIFSKAAYFLANMPKKRMPKFPHMHFS